MFTKTSPVNSVAFTPEEVELNLHLDLINYLLSFNQKSKNSYFDIHITTDGYCTIVEFATLDHEFSQDVEGFVFMDEEHYLLKRVNFPDGHYDYVDDDAAQNVMDDWLQKHPGWKRDQFGHWSQERPEELINAADDELTEQRFGQTQSNKSEEYYLGDIREESSGPRLVLRPVALSKLDEINETTKKNETISKKGH